MKSRMFKVLDEDGSCIHGGNGQWSLPHDGQPGEWMPAITGELVPCENGYHLCRECDLLEWLGPTIYEAEYRGEHIDAENKVVVREARLVRKLETWNERTARHFACDCAESVLHIFERAYPSDRRPREALEVSRRFANGETTEEELVAARAAAIAAAWATASAAASAAARAAAWAARDARDARATASAAARAAGVAASDARAAAKDAHTSRLLQYLYPN